MELLIFCENKELYSTKRLVEEASGLSFSCLVENPYDHKLEISPTIKNCTKFIDRIVLHRTTGIRYDDFDLAKSFQQKNMGANVFNSPDTLIKFRDKQNQITLLSSLGVPVIPSFSFRGELKENYLPLIKELFSEIGFSGEHYVIKTNRGNQGIGINLINGDNSLLCVLETFWGIQDQKLIIQPYLESANEYRILFCKDRVLGAINKISTQDFRKNSKRGEGNFISTRDIPKEALEIAGLAHRKTNALYSGIDIIEWKGKTFVMEVNLVPGFKQMEELSGLNIAKEIILEIVNEKKRNN